MTTPTRPDPDEAPALDTGDEDPDSLAGDFTTPDIDLSLPVADDEDGGDETEDDQ